MRSLLFLAFLALIITASYKYFYKPAPSIMPAPAAVVPPPVISKPAAPILGPEEIQKIIRTTKDPNPNVRWQALKFLFQINAPQLDTLVSEMLQEDTDITLRRNIVLMLGEHPGPTTSALLIKTLQDSDEQVRIAALTMLDKTTDYSAVSAISELLRDSDDRVRLQAISTMNSLQTKRIEEIHRQQQEEALRRQQQQASSGQK